MQSLSRTLKSRLRLLTRNRWDRFIPQPEFLGVQAELADCPAMRRACFHFRCEVCVLAFSQSHVLRVVDPVEFAAGWELAVKERVE